MDTISDSTGIRGSVESLIGGRKENQDSYGMAETRLGMLVAVCDGMGGGPAGKTASMIATQSIIDYVSGAGTEKSPFSVLADAVVSANEAVLAAVAANPSLKGMGTTCVCLLICKDKAYIVHVGDSRCYQLRGGKVIFRTNDHSYVGEMVRHGTLTEEEARTSQYSNVITRAIGGSQEIEPEVDDVDYRPGDRFALMSDGIWGAIPEPQLIRFLTQQQDPADLVPHITFNIDSLGADNGGGHDNLTLAIIDLPNSKKSGNAVIIEEDPENIASRKPQSPADGEEIASKPTAVRTPRVTAPQPADTHTADTGRDIGRNASRTELRDDDDEIPRREKKKKKPAFRRRKFSPAFWGVLVVLICCAGGVAYLLYVNAKDPEAPKTGAELIDKVTGENTDKEKGDKDGKGKRNNLDQLNKIGGNLKDTPSAKTSGNQANEYFRKAAETLQTIRDNKPQKGQSRAQMSDTQKALYSTVESLVQKGINATDDEARRKRAEAVLENLKKDRWMIIQLDSKSLPTGDAYKAIDKCKQQLASLTGSN